MRRPKGGRTGAARLYLEWWGVGLLASCLVAWLSLSGAATPADRLAYDALVRAQGGAPDERIVLVAIDNRSLEALGRWPWDRHLHAALVDRLKADGARAVAYDVLFVEPGEGDDALARALSEAGNVYLPMAADPLSTGEAPDGVLRPTPGLRGAAAGLGHVNLTVDGDGVTRRLPLGLPSPSGQTLFHLMVPLAHSVGAAPRADAGRDPLLLRWRGPPGQFRTAAFVDVLRGEVPSDVFRNKLVLVGMTADGQGDRYATPTGSGSLTPGVEVQAALLDTLLSGDAVRPAPAWGGLGLSLLVLWGLMAAFLRLSPTVSLIAAAAAGAGLLAACAAAFGLNVWLPPAAGLAGVALAYPLWSWRRLEAASAWLKAELRELDTGQGPGAAGDALQRQLDGMTAALSRLRSLNRFIADTLRSLPDATLVLDAGGRVILSNERAERLFGQGALEGRSHEALLTGLRPQGDGGELAGPGGALLHLEAASLANPEGGAASRIVRLADVTAIRTAQRQREEALQLLTHDMRAPQVSILTLIENASDPIDGSLTRRIAENARLTLKLAENYVQLARAESRELIFAPVDLMDVLTEAADVLWPQAEEEGCRIVLPSPPSEALVSGDRDLLTRVFLNLIDNALKFGPPGQEIECHLTDETIDGAAWRVCLIQDRGAGLPPDLADRMYQPFAQGDRPRGGVGLGLAFVRTVVERHGGAVSCQDRDGGGACFLIRLRAA